jgi:hypothetical protein
LQALLQALRGGEQIPACGAIGQVPTELAAVRDRFAVEAPLQQLVDFGAGHLWSKSALAFGSRLNKTNP